MSVLAGTEGRLIRETDAQHSKNTNQLNMGGGCQRGSWGMGSSSSKAPDAWIYYAFYFQLLFFIYLCIYFKIIST